MVEKTESAGYRMATPTKVSAEEAAAVGKYLRENEHTLEIFKDVKFKFKSHHIIPGHKVKSTGRINNLVVTQYADETSAARFIFLKKNYRSTETFNAAGAGARGRQSAAMEAAGKGQLVLSPKWLIGTLTELERQADENGELGLIEKAKKAWKSTGLDMDAIIAASVRTPKWWMEVYGKDSIEPPRGKRVVLTVAVQSLRNKKGQGLGLEEDAALTMGQARKGLVLKENRSQIHTLRLTARTKEDAKELYTLLRS